MRPTLVFGLFLLLGFLASCGAVTQPRFHFDPTDTGSLGIPVGAAAESPPSAGIAEARPHLLALRGMNSPSFSEAVDSAARTGLQQTGLQPAVLAASPLDANSPLGAGELAGAPQGGAQGAATPDAYGPGAGDSLLQVGFQLNGQSQSTEVRAQNGSTTTNTTQSTNISLQAGIGHFTTRLLELGAQVIGTWNFADTSDSGSLSISPYINLNIRLGRKFWLYLGPHAGAAIFYTSTTSQQGATTSNTATSFEGGAHGGARLWVTPRTSLFAEGRFTATSVELTPGVTSDITQGQLLIGFNVVF